MKKRLYVFTLVMFASVIGLLAQGLDMEKLKGMKPRSIGPAGMSGRVTAIDVVNDQPNIMYVGTASGGLWKSESGGIGWEPIFDEQGTLSIGSVAIQQSNPDVIWVGTGEGNPRNSLNGGYGIYKSIDGGKNWQLMGLENTRHIHRVIIHRDDPNTVFVGAIGSPWGEHPDRGVYRTKDGGKTWEKVLYVDEKTGAADLVVDPTNPNKLIAAMWEHRRKPWTFNSGGPGSGMYITFDGGDTWEERTDKDGLPKGELGRMGLAVAPSKPNTIYALIESKKNALYKSEDGGFKWKKINDKNHIGNRPFYYYDIYVDPRNENRIYSLFSYVNVSEDGGKSFGRLMEAYGVNNGVHPDHHAWWIHPDNPQFMIDGNDGGLNITHDGGKTWRFVENLPLAQFYHISVDMDFPYNVYGGMQDNGSWIGPGYVLKSGGIRNSYWQELYFGDGFDVVPDKDDNRYGYAMSQGGNVGRYDRITGHSKNVRPTHPDPNMKLRFNWNAAIAQDPFNNATIYYGSQFLHKSTDKGGTWNIISNDLTTNDPEKQKQYESGGLTMDATGAENYTTIVAIEPSPVQQGVIWVGTDDGNVQLTRDGGQNWTNLSSRITGMPRDGWVTQIRASNKNAGEVYVVVNNYRNYDYKPYLFRSRDFGQTWQSLVSNNSVPSYTLAVVQDPEEPRLLFLGTDVGLYVSLDEGASWTKWTHEYPSVSTMDLQIHPREHDLIMGTFGRAAWVIDDIRPLREMAKEGAGILSKTLHVFDAPNAFITMNQQAEGTRFAGEAMFSGENRQRGAIISYVINKPEVKKDEPKEEEPRSRRNRRSRNTTPEPTTEASSDEKKPKVKYDSLVMEVFNSSNELIRTVKRKAPEDMGLNRTRWTLNEKGVRFPSRQKTRPNAPEPGGVTVLPGTYKVRLSYGDQKDSTMVEVGFDPRYDLDNSLHKQRYDALKEVESVIALARKATERLVESRGIVDEYGKMLKEKKGDEWKELKDKNKAAKDSINALIDLVIGKEDKRQGITSRENPTNISFTFRARSYIGRTLDPIGDTERRVMQQARDMITPVIDKINAFYANEWPQYREAMENANLSPFKDYEPLKE